MKRIINTVLLLVITLVVTNAQVSQKELSANAKFEIYDFQKAIELYNKAKELSNDGLLNLARSYVAVRDFENAIEAYQKLESKRMLKQDEKFELIQALKSVGQDKQALERSSLYANEFGNDLRSASFNLNKPYYNQIKENDPNINVANLEFNSEDMDFGTAMFGNELIFASTRKKCLFRKQNYNWNHKPYLNLYTVSSDEDKTPTKYKIAENKKWHESSVSFYDNGNKMAFTQDNYIEKSTNGEVNLNIIFAEKVEGKWTNFQSFPLNNKEYSVGHPSLTNDGKTMYFASNMPGGIGGTDIYIIRKAANGSWGKAELLGPEINTEANELFPTWVESQQTLYFASNGHFGLGGLDVFESKLFANGKYESAYNVGAPINSKDDDFALVANSELTKGYFTSNRSEGKGDDDIYSFVDNKPDYLNTLDCEITVLNKADNSPIAKANVLMNELAKQSDKAGKTNFDLKTGVYTLKANAMGYEPSEIKNINVPLIRRHTPSIKDTLYLTMSKKIVLRNIYYDFDKWDILPESETELDLVVEFLSANPKLNVILGSHTDTRGTDKYNLKLSQLRAESAKLYLVAKGIDANRIEAKGYGESQPVVNCKEDECTSAEHRQNRRTEIEVQTLGKSQEVKQEKGDYSNGAEDHDESYSSSKSHGSIYKIKLTK